MPPTVNPALRVGFLLPPSTFTRMSAVEALKSVPSYARIVMIDILPIALRGGVQFKATVVSVPSAPV